MNETTAKQKAALWVGAVFVLGAALGGVLGYVLARHSVSASSQPLSEPERRARRLAELTHELALTPEQAKQLDAILLQRHTQAKTLHDQADAEIEQVRQNGRAEIRGLLTPDQKTKFDEFLKRTDETRKRNNPPS